MPLPPTRAVAALAATAAVVAAAGLAAAGHEQSPAPAAAADRSGKALYEAACMSCHGPDGRGTPRSLRGFEIEVPDFTDCSFATPEPDADWAAVIEHGGPVRAFDRRMPAFRGALTGDEIASILGYIRGMCADPAWPRGELNLPRALRTEKAFPENEAVLTTTFDRTGAGRVGNEFLYEQRIGARNQFEVNVPIDFQDTGTAGWQRGMGDVAVGFKRALVHSIDRGSILSAGGEVIFPTGKEDRGLGGGTTVLEPFLLYGQILPRDTFLHAQVGLELPADRDLASNAAFWRVAGGWTYAQDGGAGRAWSPMLELLAARDLASGATTRWDVVPQVQVTLNTRQHIMANVGAQVPVNERRGRGTRVMFYILWDWFDGGLFDGW